MVVSTVLVTCDVHRDGQCGVPVVVSCSFDCDGHLCCLLGSAVLSTVMFTYGVHWFSVVVSTVMTSCNVPWWSIVVSTPTISVVIFIVMVSCGISWWSFVVSTLMVSCGVHCWSLMFPVVVNQNHH